MSFVAVTGKKMNFPKYWKMLFKVKERKGSDAKNIKNVKQTLPGTVKIPGVVGRR
jgi:hypothetical protein